VLCSQLWLMSVAVLSADIASPFVRVTSLNPIYVNDRFSSQAGFVGKWHWEDPVFGGDEDRTWSVSQSDHFGYRIVVNYGHKSQAFNAHIVGLGRYTFIDLILDRPIQNVADEYFFPVHTIERVEFKGNTIRFFQSIPNWKFLKIAQSAGLSIVTVDGRPLITASSFEVQEFYRDHANDLFVAPDPKTKYLVRSKSAGAAKKSPRGN
jgi:hypothetical protein